MDVNDVYIPYIENKSRFLILYGGGMSGKSVFAAQKLVMRIKSERPHKFLALRKVGATVKDSIYAEIKDVIYTNGLEREFQINKSEYSFTHLPTDNQILCKGLDEPEKIKSIKGITGMWVEETTEFTEDDLDQLNIRIRGEKKNYVQFIYSFNPISEDNHVVKKFIIDKDYGINTSVLHTDYRSNFFLSQEDKDILESYKEKNSTFYDVYCLGVPGKVDKSNKFMYAFDEKTHVKTVERAHGVPVRLSFDFNLDPFSVLVYQRIDKSVRIFDKVRLENSDIDQVCDEILAKYPGELFHVTGDVSGRNRTGVVRGKRSYWQVIKERLSLRDSQIRLRSKNLDLLDSKLLCNSVLIHCDVQIDPKVDEFINDCKYAKCDDHGILIKDRKKQKNDFLDCGRYIFDAEFPDIIVKHKKYR